MSKSNKIIVIAISVTVAFCLTVVGITSLISSDKDDTDVSVTATQEASADANGDVQESTQFPAENSDVSESNATVPPSAQSSAAQTAPTTAFGESTTASVQDLSGAILGKWMDSAGMSGFEFSADGKVSFTYVNLSSFGVPFDGTARNGLYTLEGNILTIKFSIYTATIEKEYEVSIENDVLSMRDIEEKETSTYTRARSDESSTSSVAIPTVSVPSTTQAETTAPVSDGLEGRFLSGNKKSEITFNADGTVNVKIKRDDFSGVYQVTDDKVLIVYIDDGESVSENYDFTLQGNILTLTSSKGEASVYVKQ